jgi:hypothetical protein
VLLEIASELSSKPLDRGGLGKVVGEEQCRGGLPSEVPQQPLLRHGLGYPAHGLCTDTSEPPFCSVIDATVAPLVLSLRQHHVEAMLHPLEEPGGRLRPPVVRFVWLFAVELITVGADGHEEHVHWNDYDSIPRTAPPYWDLEVGSWILTA